MGTDDQQQAIRKHVLMADVPAGLRALAGVLGGHAAIVKATSLEEAAWVLDRVDIIVCGIAFDEYRMCDLLRAVKADPSTREMPFVCYRNHESALTRSSLHCLETACAAVRAACFIDLVELTRHFGVEYANAEFRQLLHSLLDSMPARSTPRAPGAPQRTRHVRAARPRVTQTTRAS